MRIIYHFFNSKSLLNVEVLHNSPKIVKEPNVLKDWIIEDEDVKKALGERVEPGRNLGLKYTEKRLNSLIT